MSFQHCRDTFIFRVFQRSFVEPVFMSTT